MAEPLNQEFLDELRKIVGMGNVLVDPEKLVDYGHDEFSLRDIARVPEAAVMPSDTAQVAAVLALADAFRVPVTPRGGATGLCGGCVPSAGGIVLSLEKMRAIEIDGENQMAVAEAGVTLMDFIKTVEEAGLYFPPHPGDESAMIGGLVATNAGGSRAVKYGVIRNYVRGLEVVLPDGRVIHPGGKYIKSSTGYNLMNLFIGSEGTLGIITRAVIQLMAQPPVLRTMVIPFPELEAAIETVPRLLRKNIVPVAVEFVGLDVIAITEEFLHKRWPSHEGKTHLLVILDAATEEEQDRLSQAVAEVCLEMGAIDVFIADTPAKQDDILAIRSKIYEAIKAETIEILDISVPRAGIAGHVRRVQEVAKKYDIWLPTFGHAADGNVHTHIMKARFEEGKVIPVPEGEWRDKIDAVRADLYRDGRERGGVISGEHGIGLVKKPFLSMSLEDAQIGLMKGIKKVFDPNGILNPGKIFD
ncbi:MAG: FAD-binding oxidoreductase [Candidatus Aminicenantes bacterium]|nr:FAD-binding oxidoreductase [Candidatus Aminicenantes bacterium]